MCVCVPVCACVCVCVCVCVCLCVCVCGGGGGGGGYVVQPPSGDPRDLGLGHANHTTWDRWAGAPYCSLHSGAKKFSC